MDDQRPDTERERQDGPRETQGELPVTGPPTGRVRIIGAEPVGLAADSGEAEGAGDAAAEPSVPDLPHWTEAPTGEVPSILVRDRPDADGDPWAAVPAPTWREEHSDWAAHDESFEPAMLAMDDPIAERHDSLDEERRPWAFDLDAEQGADSPARGTEAAGGGEPAASGFPVDAADDDTIVAPAPNVPAAGTQDREVPPAAAAAAPRPGSVEEGDGRGAGTSAHRDAPPRAGEGAGDHLLGIEDAGGDFEEILEGDDPRVMGESGILPAQNKRRLHVPRRHPRRSRPVPPAPGGNGPGEDERVGAPGEARSRPVRARPVPQAPVPPPAPPRPRPPKRPPAPAPVPLGVPEPRRERNMVVAIAVGLVLGAAALAAFSLGNVATLVVATAVVFLATVEAFTGFRRGGYRPAVLLGWVAVVSLMIATYNKGQVALPLLLVLLVALTMLWYVAGVERGADPILNGGATLFVFCWIGVFGSYAALLLDPNVFPDRRGIAFLVAAIVVTVIYDVAALAVGSWIGSHHLAPSISPGKTWEGAVGGAVAAVVAAMVIVRLIHPWTPGSALALGGVVAVLAPLGDLFESVVKRNLGVKDMGRLLPGHGGFLDRIDGLLFVVPATYYLVKAFNLG